MRARLGEVSARAREAGELARLSLRAVAGRRAWLVALAPALWPVVLKGIQLLDGEAYRADSVAGWLVGLPLGVLAIALGVRIVAGEIDARTIEIAYTVPGGSRRLWLARLGAAALLLAASALACGAVVFVALTGYPPSALYSAYQGALFLLAVATGFGALFRGVITGAMGAAPVLALSLLTEPPAWRISPFFNPARLQSAEAADVLAWTVQNRIGIAIAIGMIVVLALLRAERREKMLS